MAGAAAREEPLAERVVEALLARTLPNGGGLVDATAGRGTIASVARRHGVRCWSGDVAPGAPFVVEANARELLTGAVPHIARHYADLLVVHPPTFSTWASSSPHDDGGLDAYRDEVGATEASVRIASARRDDRGMQRTDLHGPLVPAAAN